MDQAPDKLDSHERHHQPHAPVGDLPMKADAPPEARTSPAPQKDINKTLGGRLTHLFTYWGQGMIGNSGLSVAITYFVMPKEWVKKPKDAIAKAMSSIFKGEEHERLRAANNTIEIMIMMIAGTVLTATMVPFAKNHEKIAHWVNKKLGRDQDVLPSDMQPVQAPRTLEEKIQQEIHSRVNKHHSSGDVWSARWTALAVPFFGDMALSKWNSKREAAGKTSVDTYVWEKGAQFYDKVLSKKKWVERLSDFFEDHGAGVKDIKERAPEKFKILEETLKEAEPVNKSRVMVAEQARMLSKEVGWTIILAAIMEQLVAVYHNHRVRKEESKAVADVTREGLVPDGYKIVLDKRSNVELQPVAGRQPRSWAEKNPPKPQPEKVENFAAAVDSSRTAAGQPAIS